MNKADPDQEQAESKSPWIVLLLFLLLRWPTGGFGGARAHTRCALSPSIVPRWEREVRGC